MFLIYRSADICIYVEKLRNNSPSRSHERRGMLFVLILCTLANTISLIGSEPINHPLRENNESERDVRE